jgi:hypothetical protein
LQRLGNVFGFILVIYGVHLEGVSIFKELS